MTSAPPPLKGTLDFPGSELQLEFVARLRENDSNDSNDSSVKDIGKRDIEIYAYNKTRSRYFKKFNNIGKYATYYLEPPSENKKDKNGFKIIYSMFVDDKMVGFGFFKNRSPCSLQFLRQVGWINNVFDHKGLMVLANKKYSHHLLGLLLSSRPRELKNAD